MKKFVIAETNTNGEQLSIHSPLHERITDAALNRVVCMECGDEHIETYDDPNTLATICMPIALVYDNFHWSCPRSEMFSYAYRSPR